MMQDTGARRVLVCENHNKPGMGVGVELQKFAWEHHFEIVTVTGREAALRLLQAQPFAIAVIDVGRESGEAQTLLRSIGNGFPSLPLFVFNGFMIPGISEKAREYEQVQYCEDPRELDRCIALLLENLPGKKKGTIEGIRLTNFLDWLNSEKLSGQVVVSSGDQKGLLYFQEGRLVGASTGDEHGSQTALTEISAWEKVTVEIKEGKLPEGAASPQASPMALAPKRRRELAGAFQGSEGGGSNIEMLRLVRGGRDLNIRIRDLRLAIEAIRGILGDSLLRMDIFLSRDGRSLAGWNSHPLACSTFATITRALVKALEASRFPSLGNYYLIDLAEEKLAMIMVCGELQMGMLMTRDQVHMGLLTNIILPEAAKALNDSYTVEHPA